MILRHRKVFTDYSRRKIWYPICYGIAKAIAAVGVGVIIGIVILEVWL